MQTFSERIANIVVHEVNRTPCFHCNAACVNKVHKKAICTVEDVNAAHAASILPAEEAEARRANAAIEKARNKARAKVEKAAYLEIAGRNKLLAKKAARDRKRVERSVFTAGEAWISEVIKRLFKIIPRQ